MLEVEWYPPIFPFTNFTGLLFLLVVIVLLVQVFILVYFDIFVLFLGFTGAGIAALCGCNLPALMEAIKFHPIVLYGLKFFMSYALGYHYFCGLRHIVFINILFYLQYFDYYPDKLTWKFIQSSSICIIWGVAALALVLTVIKLPALKNKEKKEKVLQE